MRLTIPMMIEEKKIASALPCQPISKTTTSSIVNSALSSELDILYMPNVKGFSSHRHNTRFA